MKICTLCNKEQPNSNFGKYRYDLLRCTSCHTDIVKQNKLETDSIKKNRIEAYQRGELRKPETTEYDNKQKRKVRKSIGDMQYEIALKKELEEFD